MATANSLHCDSQPQTAIETRLRGRISYIRGGEGKVLIVSPTVPTKPLIRILDLQIKNCSWHVAWKYHHSGLYAGINFHMRVLSHCNSRKVITKYPLSMLLWRCASAPYTYLFSYINTSRVRRQDLMGDFSRQSRLPVSKISKRW